MKYGAFSISLARYLLSRYTIMHVAHPYKRPTIDWSFII